MAKKWIAVLLVICIGLGAGVVYMREQSDRQAPEIIAQMKQRQNIIRE